MLSGYPVTCTSCPAAARYKIAAVWTDGLKHELKTYYLSCDRCLAGHFAQATAKHAECALTDGESLLPPAIYERLEGLPLLRRDDLAPPQANRVSPTR